MLSSAPKCSIALNEERKIFSTSAVEQLPVRSQMSFGGPDRRTPSSWKSKSLDTIAKSFVAANSQMAASLAPPRPQLWTWAEPTNRSASRETSLGDRFSSSSSFTGQKGGLPLSIRCESQTGANVLRRQIWKILQDLFLGHAGS
jgi:hypothetical protein